MVTKKDIEKVKKWLQENNAQTKPTRVLGDEFDVMQIGFVVHDKDARKNLTEDFIVADFTDAERRFIRKGLRITRHIDSFMDVSRFEKKQDEKKIKVCGEEFERYTLTEEQIEGVSREKTKVKNRMLKEYKEMAVLTRGKGARMINALIELIAQGRRRVKPEEGVLDKVSPEENFNKT